MTLDVRRGTPVWAFMELRKVALVKLMSDLVDREDCGLPDADCNRVKATLEKMAVVFSGVPDSKAFLKTTIHARFVEFADAYERWNDEPKSLGPDEHDKAAKLRKKLLRRMQQSHQRFSSTQRKNMHILDRELDLKLTQDLYGLLGSLSKSLPEVFKGVGESVAKFIGKHDKAESAE